MRHVGPGAVVRIHVGLQCEDQKIDVGPALTAVVGLAPECGAGPGNVLVGAILVPIIHGHHDATGGILPGLAQAVQGFIHPPLAAVAGGGVEHVLAVVQVEHGVAPGGIGRVIGRQV